MTPPQFAPDRRQFLKSATALALAGGATRVFGSPLLTGSRPNVLILISDQISADALSSVIGTRYLNTPNLDALAARSLRFARAYAANPLCVPSRTSMFTGRYPVETGIQTNAAITPPLDAALFPTFGTLFRNAGYQTAYFGKWHLPYTQSNIDSHGFETIATEVVDVETADHVADFLGKPHPRPFLAIASFLNPHNICEWARGGVLDQGALPAPPPGADCPPLRSNYAFQIGEPEIVGEIRRSYQASPMFAVAGYTEEHWRQYEWAYYRLIERVDAQIGKVTRTLQDKGLAENTVVVFLADHGDCQGAHHFNQKTILYEEALRVPFYLSLPGEIAHGTSQQLVNTGVDLLPTLCDFAGIPVPAAMPGASLRSIATGGSRTLDRGYVVSSDHMIQGADIDEDGKKETPMPQGRMIRSERFKYTVWSEGRHRESFIDLVADPGETVNLAYDARYESEVAHHRVLLNSWGSRFRDNFPYVTASS